MVKEKMLEDIDDDSESYGKPDDEPPDTDDAEQLIKRRLIKKSHHKKLDDKISYMLALKLHADLKFIFRTSKEYAQKKCGYIN